MLLIMVIAIAMVVRIPMVKKRLPSKIYAIPVTKKRKKPTSWLKRQQRKFKKLAQPPSEPQISPAELNQIKRQLKDIESQIK